MTEPPVRLYQTDKGGEHNIYNSGSQKVELINLNCYALILFGKMIELLYKPLSGKPSFSCG
jgi:hypothetical protein